MLRLFGYDGVLPAIVLLAPTILHVVFRGASWVELLAIVLPIAAYIIRAELGLRLIERNQSSPWLRRAQKTSLYFALLILLMVDACAILMCTLPQNCVTNFDRAVLFVLYLLYLALMAVATFPSAIARTD